MSIDIETVDKIAFLSRLKIEDNVKDATKEEFNKIIQWVDQLKEVKTDNVEPLISVNENSIQLREDEVTQGQCSKEILANAPMKEYGYFAVPKVVE
ncbi:MAG: Asp-tRNA(Asn)/Glu-tRNA(Gln) amidotransferase subunit GatC [Alphaproteobacteria bacterium]|nr:Asp-tRNA(Asn)/Glu-tRNA(Gln) amidotransferase subunit GatC [Alphaproteobacteria bacterium]